MRTTVDLQGPVHVERLGAGPPLLLLHGLGSSHVHWMGVAPALARRHRVHILDLPGSGLSPLARRSPGLIPASRLVAAYLDRLRQPAVLVGNSMGALIALLVAARERPARVPALAMVALPAPRPLGTPLERDPRAPEMGIRRRVFATRALETMLARAEWHFRAVRRRAKVLGATELGVWAAER